MFVERWRNGTEHTGRLRSRPVSLAEPVVSLPASVASPWRRLATRYLTTGLAEMWRDWWKPAFVRELQRYVPEIRPHQLVFGPSGVRAQALGRDGTLVDDFVLGGNGRILHVRNAPSPAATSSLAIGAMLATTALERLDAA